MFWLLFWGYVAVGLFVASPVICHHLYAKARQDYYNEKGEIHRVWSNTVENRRENRVGNVLTFKEVQDLIWSVDRHGIIPLSVLGGLVWPVSLYIIMLKYSTSYRDMKERQRQLEQKQQEEDLIRARKIIAESKSIEDVTWTNEFKTLEKGTGKLASKLGRGKKS